MASANKHSQVESLTQIPAHRSCDVEITPSPIICLSSAAAMPTSLTINAGGSSVRLDVFEQQGDSQQLKNIHSKHGKANEDVQQLLKDVAHAVPHINTVFHRIVHGGPHFQHPTVVDQQSLRLLESLETLDPLHNPPALRWVHESLKALPDARQVLTFDTTYFHQLPAEARTIPLPHKYVEKYELRRYGFHGMAHKSMYEQFAAQCVNKQLTRGGRLITMQLGSGCSITCLRDGRVLDTSMGFGPLEGLLMTTRTGDIDPAVLFYLQRQEKLSATDMEAICYKQSGLLALSHDESNDMGDLLASHTEAARQSVTAFCYSVLKYIGAYSAVLGGVDGICFGGGIGEKGHEVRRRVCERLGWLGVELDEARNKGSKGTGRISKDGGKVEVWVIEVDEAAVMVEEGKQALQATEKDGAEK